MYIVASADKSLDFLAVWLATCAANAVCQVFQPKRCSSFATSTVMLWAAGFAVVFVFLLERNEGYRSCVSLLGVRESERILRALAQTVLIATLSIRCFGIRFPGWALLLVLFNVPLFLAGKKFQTYKLWYHLRRNGYRRQRALILGTGPASKRAYSSLVRSPKLGIDPVAFVGDGPQPSSAGLDESWPKYDPAAKFLTGPLDRERFGRLKISALVIAGTQADRESLSVIMAEAREAGVRTYVIPDESLMPGAYVDYTALDGMVLGQAAADQPRQLYEVFKRVSDTIFAIGLVLLLSPLLAWAALRVKLSSPGPVFFRQPRVGKDGELFTIWKFRTMYVDAPLYGVCPQEDSDSRVTPTGRKLRRSSIDELPQLINVIRGEMSLVGPRPEMPFIVDSYDENQRRRLAVKPGMTGLWQISPARRQPIHENPEYDTYYTRYRNFFMDLAILLHTPFYAGGGV